ncbi:MAG: DUF262 domain-containing protein [Microthrixaceae bacterium]
MLSDGSQGAHARDLFDGKVCYEIPPFQRPYVWTEEDQWQPLWDDITRVSEAVFTAGDDAEALKALSGHFLGAVVVKQLPSGAGDPARLSVIDGQQRLTTLQLLLDAAQLVMELVTATRSLRAFTSWCSTTRSASRGTSKRFKLWQTSRRP